MLEPIQDNDNMSDFGKTTIFNGLLGNRPDVFCWASDYLIWDSFWSPE
jgi:hypothetical protein